LNRLTRSFKLCIVPHQALAVIRHEGRKIAVDGSSERGAGQSARMAHRRAATRQASPANNYLGRCSLNSFAMYDDLTIANLQS